MSIVSNLNSSDFEEAKKNCDKGNTNGCAKLGELYYNGRGVARSFYRAAKLNKKACDEGNNNGCFNLGMMYRDGDGVNNLHRNLNKSTELLTELCNDKYAEACLQLGLLHSVMGDLVVQNYFKAKSFYSKGCQEGSGSACFFLGSLYEEGKGVRQNSHKAKELYTKSCDSGDDRSAYGCFFAGNLYEKNQNYLQAKKFYGKACDKEMAMGCEHYARLNKKSF